MLEMRKIETKEYVQFRAYLEDSYVGQIYFYKKPNNHYVLQGLEVARDFRRRGIAIKLIKIGQEFADSIELNCYQSFLTHMYNKCGFKITGECEMMVRDPDSGKLQVRMEWRKEQE